MTQVFHNNKEAEPVHLAYSKVIWANTFKIALGQMRVKSKIWILKSSQKCSTKNTPYYFLCFQVPL